MLGDEFGKSIFQKYTITEQDAITVLAQLNLFARGDNLPRLSFAHEDPKTGRMIRIFRVMVPTSASSVCCARQFFGWI